MPDVTKSIADHPIAYLLGTAVAAFILGFAAFKGLLEVAKLETIRSEELARIRSENDQLKQKLKESGRTEGAIERIVPSAVHLTPVTDPPEWLALIVSLLNVEGTVEKARGGPFSSSERFGVGASEHVLSQATKPFAWRLSPRPLYTITAWAFRATGDGRLIQPVERRAADDGAVAFLVPECLPNDRLIAIVRAKWSHDSLVKDLTETFASEVRKE